MNSIFEKKTFGTFLEQETDKQETLKFSSSQMIEKQVLNHQNRDPGTHSFKVIHT